MDSNKHSRFMSAAYDQLRSEPSVKVTIAACQSVDSKGYEIFFSLKFVGLYEKNLQQQRCTV